MSEGYHNDINIGLQRIGAEYSSLDEKQKQIVQLIKRQEIRPQLNCSINQNIPGLRKKAVPFLAKPAHQRYWFPWATYERNGHVNIGITRNYSRLIFPTIAVFFMWYIAGPVVNGTIYVQQYDNFQHEAVYFKFTANRHLYIDQVVPRYA